MREAYRGLPHCRPDQDPGHMRRLSALALATVGLALGVIAAVGFIANPGDIGDREIVEAALSAEGATASTAITTIPAPVTTTASAEPRWAPNDLSLLTDVAISTGPKPARLRIDAMAIDAPVGHYGVADNGQMDVPDNVTEVGWYKFGPSPGEPGSAVLAAHVDLAGPGRGLFYDLGKLAVDDTVEVTFDDGETRSFRVVARSTYLKSELPLDVIFSREGDPVVTLVTCGGGFSRSTGSYDSNVVVFAVPFDEKARETPDLS